MTKRILQANLNNLGGAFSVAYEAQKKLEDEYKFDYFSAENFEQNEVYNDLIRRGSKCIGGVKNTNRFLKQYKVYKTMKDYLKKNSYDFVHIHADTAWKMAVYYLAAKHAGSKNIVVHAHSSGISGHHRMISYLLHILCKSIIKGAKYKCACSDTAAKWMFDTTENINIIQNGVDIEKYRFNKNSRKNIREKYKIAADVKVVGTVSDFSFPKNPEFIFKIIKSFKNRQDYLFLMVGNRKSGCRLKDLVEKDGDIDNVIFSGSVTNVEAYLSAMDIFILPSKFEGLPMCAVEAQVSGAFTIISDNITTETQCSKYYNRLPLSMTEWIKCIENTDTLYNRDNISEYLTEKTATADGTAEGFKKIYLTGDSHE